ncbi:MULTISPECIES: hypothetical protein [Chryseobacterium]|jgi:uncharacterized membrane protein|uniref:DUF2231 domain-containing protein n=1 Tax=Chryseobacterium bernardetii TaxID=1241978 RepID=A0A3G6TG49_9FLAO|nr:MULTISPECIES: hypothetical protein [Chryseobacterium]AZB26967.1 hypothetical protein EG339_21445 [Chryseobacterium bernardetii]AZB33351.1 hypothetical protein EG351_06815 [Chryseobacterium bernardetii]UCA61174.1 hypothetical protein KB553_06495 [Chryseobacterium rhizoplanae]
MNNAHWHLVFNHLPIIIPIVGLLTMIGGFIFRSEAVKRTSYFIFILGAISTIPAFATGEGAEEAVEHIQGIDEKFIKIHEEAAEKFAVLSYILGGISLIGLWASFKEKTFSNIIAFVTIALSVVVLVLAKQAGTTGGEIRHTEIREGNNAAVSNSNADSDDDDD